MQWVRPSGTRGDTSLVRVSSVIAREEPDGCERFRAVKVRPRVWPTTRRRRTENVYESFALSPLMAALDHLEFEGNSVEDVIAELRHTSGRFAKPGAPAHPGLLEWTIEAITRFVDARAERHDAVGGHGGRLEPVPTEWVACYGELTDEPDKRGIRRFERTAWGRRYASSDGRLRELWMPTFGSARADRSDAELAAAAAVLADGVDCARGAGAGAPYEPLAVQAPPPDLVRLVSFGSLDGTTRPVFEGDPDSVRQMYKTHTADIFRRTVVGDNRNPGSNCVDCRAIDRCDALPVTSGLWDRSAARRPTPRPRQSLSVWDLRVHAECPARYHLYRQLKLRASSNDSAAARRGRAVDAWLNERHSRPAAGGCRTRPGPSNPSGWSSGGHDLSGRHALDGASMIAQHRALCPVGRSDSFGDFRVQHQITTYLPEIDIIVIATPDLTYTDAGNPVWRETKTSTSPLWEGRPLMRTYPQLAMAVLLLAADAIPGSSRQSRVELELLLPDRSNLEILDPTRNEVVDEARAAIAELAQPLIEDDTFSPTPGSQCHTCEVSRWCGPGRELIASDQTAGIQEPR